MKRTIRLIPVALLAVLSPLLTHAQKHIGEIGAVTISPLKVSLTGEGDSLSVRLSIQASDLRIKGDRSLTMDLRLAGGNKEVVLPSVVWAGKKRYRYDKRKGVLDGTLAENKPYHTFVGIRRGKSYTMEYDISIPYAQWMDKASLEAVYSYNDCCRTRAAGEHPVLADVGHALSESKYADREVRPGPELYAKMVLHIDPRATPEDQPAAVLPGAVEPETAGSDAARYDKTPGINPPTTPYPGGQGAQSDTGSETIHSCIPGAGETTGRVQPGIFNTTFHYPSNDYTLNTALPENILSVERLAAVLDEVEADPCLSVSEITVTGYASPEGPWADNEILARNRSYDISNYLERYFPVGNARIVNDWVAEDWDTLEQAISEGDMTHKRDILRIIRGIGIFQGRERALMMLNGGRDYNKLLIDEFPPLRRTRISVRISGNGPAAGQTRETFFEAAGASTPRISADASRYDTTDPQYRAVCETAAKEPPQDPLANNNAAAACLAEGDTEAAWEYLRNLPETPATNINLGVYHLQRGDIKTARSCFVKALRDGCEAGAVNLTILDELE